MSYSNQNRNDRYNDSFNDREQYNRDNDDNYGQNFGRSNYGNRSQNDNFNQNSDRRDYQGGYQDYQNRNWSDQNRGGRSDFNSSDNWRNQGTFNRNDDNQQWGRQGFNDRNQGFGNNRNQGFGSGNDSRNSGGYNSSRNQDSRNYGQQDRNWFDRTKDEVSSWFGDDDAERRRRQDKNNEGQHRGKGPKGYKRSDERLQDDINDRLSDDVHIDASEIEVKVSNGEVTLTGTVDRREAKRHAEDIAESVSGVTHVQNNLRVSNNSGANTDKDVSYGTPSAISGSGSASATANTGVKSTESAGTNGQHKAKVS